MFRQLMFSCACLAVLSAEAQKDKPWWLDPEVNEVNTMAPRAAFFAYETENLAKADQKARSERYLSLEGKWKFNFSKDHEMPFTATMVIHGEHNSDPNRLSWKSVTIIRGRTVRW